MHNAVMIALSAPISKENEAAFNQWYDEIHLFEVAGMPGVVAARRYKVAEVVLPDGLAGPTHSYVAIYELLAQTECELQEFIDAIKVAMQSGHFDMSGPIDLARAGATLALPIGQSLSLSN